MDLSDLISGHSKALYSTWMLYRPDHLLIDCGEGAATTLGNAGYLIEKVLLTHGHSDHITGLPTLLWSRAAGMGDNEKPLQIFYPRDDSFVDDMRRYLERGLTRLPFELSWTPLDAGDSIALDANSSSRHARTIETFATRHIKNRLTLGYKIVETRRRLKPEFAQISQAEIAQIARTRGRDAVAEMMEDYAAIIAAWGGDSMPLNAQDVRGAELLAHDATLLDKADRQQRTHSVLQEAIEVGVQAGVKTLLLYHFSGRYRASEIREAVAGHAQRQQVKFLIWCLFRDRLWHAWPPSEKQNDDRPSSGRRLLIARAEKSDITRNTAASGAVQEATTSGEHVAGGHDA